MALSVTVSSEPAKVIKGKDFRLKMMFSDGTNFCVTAFKWSDFDANSTCSGWGQSGLSTPQPQTRTIDCTAKANRGSPGNPPSANVPVTVASTDQTEGLISVVASPTPASSKMPIFTPEN